VYGGRVRPESLPAVNHKNPHASVAR
jgi:hypothetical protein